MVYIKVLLLLMFIFSTNATDVFYIKTTENPKDERSSYDFKLLKLALEKTKDEHGEYTLKIASDMNFARAMHFIQNNQFKNLIIKRGLSSNLLNKQITFADFPINLGIANYRICFINKDMKINFSKAKNINDLKSFVFGHGIGWLDTIFFKNSALTVQEISTYEALFTMVANGRIDAYCRGLDEIFNEFDMHSHINELVYDESILIHYSQPRFFIANIANKKIITRIEKGLKIAFEDGSLMKLWVKKHQTSIERANLIKRKVIFLASPFHRSEERNVKNYLYKRN